MRHLHSCRYKSLRYIGIGLQLLECNRSTNVSIHTHNAVCLLICHRKSLIICSLDTVGLRYDWIACTSEMRECADEGLVLTDCSY